MNSDLEKQLRSLLELTTGNHNPNINPLIQILKNIPIISWNLKVHGYLLSKLLFDKTNLSELPISDDPFTPKWQASISKDFLTSWFRQACKELQIEPIFHRKIWEYSYVINNLKHYNLIKHDLNGIGFGCGLEPLPSFFASRGVNITATDLHPSNSSSKVWRNSNQHLNDISKIWHPNLCEKNLFFNKVSLRYEDMNNISSDLNNKFDFCWSICSLEHLGSIQKGLDFIKKSLDVLKPGGLAIHTTEFNFSNDDKTIDNWPTVLFRKKDFQKLYDEIKKNNYEVPIIDFNVGDNPLDWFIDLPPYSSDSNDCFFFGGGGYYFKKMPQIPHLKLSIDGFPSTCFGVVIRKLI
jgi:SAM-dependent methyltransferase